MVTVSIHLTLTMVSLMALALAILVLLVTMQTLAHLTNSGNLATSSILKIMPNKFTLHNTSIKNKNEKFFTKNHHMKNKIIQQIRYGHQRLM